MCGNPRRMILSALIAVLPGLIAQAEFVDAVVATVDREVILYSEIVSVIGVELENIRNSSQSQREYDRRADVLVKATLEEAIESKILLREARKFSVVVSDEEVEERVDSLRDRYESDEEFMAELQAAGESLSDFRDRTRKQVMSQRLAYSKLVSLESEIVVSESEILLYYQDNKARFEHPERVRVRQIFLLAGEEPKERARARARLEVLRDEIEAGADFEDLARLHSEAPGAEEGGIIGWQQRGELVVELETAVFSLPENVTSDVVETRRGVHLLQVDDREDAGIADLEEVRSMIEPQIRSAAAEERYRVWLADLRKRSKVRIFL